MLPLPLPLLQFCSGLSVALAMDPVHEVDGHGLAWPGGQALILLLVLALALALVLALGPFPSSINSSTSSSILLLHPLTHLSPHFTSPSPPLFSLSLLSPSLSPFSSPLLVPLLISVYSASTSPVVGLSSFTPPVQ